MYSNHANEALVGLVLACSLVGCSEKPAASQSTPAKQNTASDDLTQANVGGDARVSLDTAGKIRINHNTTNLTTDSPFSAFDRLTKPNIPFELQHKAPKNTVAYISAENSFYSFVGTSHYMTHDFENGCRIRQISDGATSLNLPDGTQRAVTSSDVKHIACFTDNFNGMAIFAKAGAKLVPRVTDRDGVGMYGFYDYSEAKNVKSLPANTYNAVFSRKGDYCAVGCNRPNAIALINLNTLSIQMLNATEFPASFSPDGKHFYCFSGEQLLAYRNNGTVFEGVARHHLLDESIDTPPYHEGNGVPQRTFVDYQATIIYRHGQLFLTELSGSEAQTKWTIDDKELRFTSWSSNGLGRWSGGSRFIVTANVASSENKNLYLYGDLNSTQLVAVDLDPRKFEIFCMDPSGRYAAVRSLYDGESPYWIVQLDQSPKG